MASEPILGIDLGTSNSCVAVVTDDGPVIIPNRGHKTTPSVIAFAADGTTTIGHAAKAQAVTKPDDTFVAIKRLIGRRYSESEVKGSSVQGVFESEHGDLRVKHGDRVYALAELNALILADLKVAAEAHLGGPVTKAIITVPAHFTDGQRQATRDAGTIAGLDVIRLLNEPTAVAVAYGHVLAQPKKVVVYDLGSGTFDVSIVSCLADGTFEVLGTAGDTSLGGEDFDRIIAEWLAERFKREHGIDPPNDHATRTRFRVAAEEAKQKLSTRDIVEIDVPEIVNLPDKGALHLRCTLTRHVFDHKTKKLVATTIDLTKEALDGAGCSIADIDDLLLVGGASRTPSIQHAISTFLGKSPSPRVNPDEAVALGAALLAQGMDGTLTLKDRTPYTLGIRLRGNRREVVIPKNTPMPARARRNFATTVEGQSFVDVVILQGESEAADECALLADYRLDALRPGPPGSVSIDVSVTVDESGIVSVTASDVATRNAQPIQVLASGGLSRADVARMRDAQLASRPGETPGSKPPLEAAAPSSTRGPVSAAMPIRIAPPITPSAAPLPPSISQTLGQPLVAPVITRPPVISEVPTSSVTQPIPVASLAPLLRESRPVRYDPRAEEEDSSPPPVSMPVSMPRSEQPTPSRPRIDMLAPPLAAAAISVVPAPTVSVKPSEPSADLPPLESFSRPPVSVAPVTRRVHKPSSGYRAQVRQLIGSLEAASRTAATVLAGSDFAMITLEEGQVALARAQQAIANDDENAMRDCAFELARVEQTLSTLLA